MQLGPNRKPPGRAPNCERGIYAAVSPRAIAERVLHRRLLVDAGDWWQAFDTQVAFAPEIMHLGGRGYYAGYSAPNRAQILRAKSDDGLVWRKEPHPAIAPGDGGLDAAKCSEMCVVQLPSAAGLGIGYRILYEGCDGTAIGERGI